MSDTAWRDRFEQAFPGGHAGSTCPEIDELIAAVAGEGEPGAVGPLLEHAAQCPVCGAEAAMARRLLARAAGPVPAADELAERLRQRVERQLGPPAADGRAPSRRSWLAAAAGVLAVAGALALWTWGPGRLPPPLPLPPDHDTVRGAAVELLAPLGDVDLAPSSFRWRSVESAASYRLRVRSVDGRVLWEHEVRTGDAAPEDGVLSAAVDETLLATLQPNVRYEWQVVASAADTGSPLAVSWPASFRIRPPR